MAKFNFYPEITEIDMRDVTWDKLKISGFPWLGLLAIMYPKI